MGPIRGPERHRGAEGEKWLEIYLTSESFNGVPPTEQLVS